MKIGIWPAIGLMAFTALVTWGISRPQTASLGAAGQLAQGEVLATVNGYEITRQEVEEIAPDRFLRAQQQLFELTEQALEQVIARKMVSLEAEKEGIEGDTLIAREVLSKIPEPSESEIDSIYEVYRQQVNAPRDSAAPQIRDFLTRQDRTAAMQAYLLQLRARYEVTNLMEPARIEVEAIGPSHGPEDAPVTLVEFSDFECPFCLRFLPTIEQVKENYPDQVRIVYRQFPLKGLHPNAQIAAEASLCADAQGKFWEMHDAIFEVRGKADAEELKTMAAELGLDSELFSACLDSGEFRGQVAADLQAGRQAGVSGTPAFFINGRFLSGAQPFSTVSRVIDDELARVGGDASGS